MSWARQDQVSRRGARRSIRDGGEARQLPKDTEFIQSIYQTPGGFGLRVALG
jgi:hypothetical protein